MAIQRSVWWQSFFVASLLLGGRLVWGQEPPAAAAVTYKQPPYNANLTRTEQSELQHIYNQIKSELDPLAAHPEEFDKYFRDMIFPQMTTPDKVAKANETRAKIKALFHTGLNKPGVKDAHDRANQITLKAMSDLAGGPDYDPRARYNAMLLVGDLDDVEPTNRTPGVPFAGALIYLERAAGSSESPDYIKVAALIGIKRHAEAANSSASADTKLLQVVQSIAFETKPPAGRTPDGHAWMRRRAIEIIGTLGNAEGGKITADLQKIVKDPAEPLALRCTAAKAIGQLNYTGVAVKDPTALVRDIGRLGWDATKHEMQEPELARNRLKSYLHMVKIGLSGPDDGSKPGLKGVSGAPPAADAASKAISEMMASLDANAIDKLPAQSEALGVALGIAAGPAAAVAPAAAPAAAAAVSKPGAAKPAAPKAANPLDDLLK